MRLAPKKIKKRPGIVEIEKCYDGRQFSPHMEVKMPCIFLLPVVDERRNRMCSSRGIYYFYRCI